MTSVLYFPALGRATLGAEDDLFEYETWSEFDPAKSIRVWRIVQSHEHSYLLFVALALVFRPEQAARQIEAWSPGTCVRIAVEDDEDALPWPVRPAALRRAIRQAVQAPAPKPDIRLSGRILLVEDNAVNQRVASALLLKLGLEVDVAADGGTAIERCRTQRYDAILMDCTMPGMDGYEATRRIRALERGTIRHTPIIALTANALDEARRECLEAGMDDFASKPVRLDTLKPLLATWLASSA